MGHECDVIRNSIMSVIREIISFRLKVIIRRSEQFTLNLEMLWESYDFIIVWKFCGPDDTFLQTYLEVCVHKESVL